MYSLFPERFWSPNPGQQDLETSTNDRTGHTKASSLERPLPPLPASTHSRNNSANGEPLSSPLEQFYQQHASQYQQKLNRSEESFLHKPSLSSATTVDSLALEKGQYRHAGSPSRRGRYRSLVNSLSPCFSEWWLGEILCWIAGTLCIGAIILVLALYDGQPVPTRWPLGITLNAFISVISAIGKFSLAVPVNESLGELKWLWYSRRTSPTQSDDQVPRLIDFETFDQASRGPWGAILLATRLRTRSIASIGATITVLSLALDPFFQQVVTYPQRPRSNGRSTVARVVSYNPTRYSYLDNGVRTFKPPDALLVPIGGVIGDTIGTLAPSVPLFCPSDDCQWPQFQTLGVCSQCQDISQYLTLACLNENGEWKSDRARAINETVYAPTRSCGYFLNASSAAPILMSGYSIRDNGSMGEALAARTFALHDFDMGQKFWDGSLLYKSTQVPLIDFLTVGTPVGSSPYSNSSPIALECVLKLCVQTIKTSFFNGNILEHVVDTFENNSQSSVDQFVGNVKIGTLRHNFHNETIIPPGQATKFQVPNGTIFDFAYALSSLFPSSLTTQNETTPYSLKYQIYTGWETTAIFTNFTAMRSPGQVPSKMNDLAKALTNVMRSNPSTSEQVFGTGSFETYVHARYGWLALPLVVAAATLGFLITTIRQASKANAGIWKTSSLATLMHGLSWDAKMSGEERPVWRMDDMMEKAKYLSVRLDRYKEGGTLDCEYHRIERRFS